jgi:hypothetical protein
MDFDDGSEGGGGVKFVLDENTSVDIDRFNAGMEGLVRIAKLEPVVVVRKESGELMKTLVRVTPPKDPGKTRERIARTIKMKFTAAESAGSGLVSSTSRLESSTKNGKGEIEWLLWSPQFLRGIAKEADRRNDSVDELMRLSYRLTPKGRKVLPFRRFRNRRQKVMIYGNILTNPKTVAALIRRVQGHVGRLKAGWLVAWADGKITIMGSNLPPQWVTRHARGARGRFIDGLGVENAPFFAIGNSAVGIGEKQVRFFVRSALGIRAKAMAENARLIFSGRKKLADYARGKVLVFKDG